MLLLLLLVVGGGDLEGLLHRGLLTVGGRGHRHRVRGVAEAGHGRLGPAPAAAAAHAQQLSVAGAQRGGGLTLRHRQRGHVGRRDLLRRVQPGDGGSLSSEGGGSCGGRGGGGRVGRGDAEVVEDDPLAEEGGGVGGLDGLLWLRLLALDLLVLDGVEVDLADAVDDVLVLEGDEAEPAVPLGLLVHEHDGLLHLAELREVGAHLVRRSLLRRKKLSEISYE